MMEPREHVALAMIPEFELDGEDAIQAKVWAALDAKLMLGMTLTEVYSMTGLNEKQLEPYELAWERMRGAVYA